MASPIYTYDSTHTNGEIIVHVLRDSNWQEAGKLSYGRFIQEKKLEILELESSKGFVKLKLKKNGGGNAHLDFISLGDEVPTVVNGKTDLIKKLSDLDFDVISIDENWTELTLPLGKSNNILSIGARIENSVISKTPFLFPLQNPNWIINQDSTFFTYEFDSIMEKPELDNMLNTMETKKPFFKQHCLPGSGHPQGYVYGWVMNDDDNLYLALDVTPDNTMDGDKDYAKLYVNTIGGIKEFKITEAETKWGNSSFVYTDKVKYQHKVYEFVIPLEEIGIIKGNNVQDLSLAFSFYGTAADPIYFEDVSYKFDEDAGLVSIKVLRPSGEEEWSEKAVVTYNISDVSATCGLDYEVDLLSDTLVFDNGITELSIPITIIDDEEYEPDIESFNISISLTEGGSSLGYNTEATINIVDNDEAEEEQKLIYFHSPWYFYSEGMVGDFYVARECADNDYSPISIGYRVIDGTATYNDDYFIERTGTIEFGEGMIQTSGPSIFFNYDGIFEEDEQFSIELYNLPEGYVLGEVALTTINIQDNEPLPYGGRIEFDMDNYTVIEDSPGYAEITVNFYPEYTGPMSLLSNDMEMYDNVISVVYGTSDGTAHEEKDYEETTGIITFDIPAFEYRMNNQAYHSQSFRVPIVSDKIVEPDEYLNIALSLDNPIYYDSLRLNNVPNYIVLDEAILTIIDDDEIIDDEDDNNDDYYYEEPIIVKKSPPSTEGLPNGTIIDRMKGYIVLSEPKNISSIKDEITLSYDEDLLERYPTHSPRIYCWNPEKENWVALATYPVNEGKVKAINDGEYKGWFVIFGVIQPVFTDLQENWAEQLINRMNGLGMIEGYKTHEGNLIRTAKSNQNVTNAEYAMLISRILNIDIDDPKLPLLSKEEAKAILSGKFTDSGHIPDWVLSVVGTLAKANLLIEEKESFNPDTPITRIDAAVMTSKALQFITQCKKADLDKFVDKEDIPEWAKSEIVEGVLEGYPDNSIKPYNNLTRAESLMLLYRLFVKGLGW